MKSQVYMCVSGLNVHMPWKTYVDGTDITNGSMQIIHIYICTPWVHLNWPTQDIANSDFHDRHL